MVLDAITMLVRIVLLLMMLSVFTSLALMGWIYLMETRRYFRIKKEKEQFNAIIKASFGSF